MFQGYPVPVLAPHERQDLLDGFARSIREVEIRESFQSDIPRHGIVFTMGDRKREFAISFESSYVYAFRTGGNGLPGVTFSGKEDSYFQMTPRAWSAFNDFLDRDGAVRGWPAGSEIK